MSKTDPLDFKGLPQAVDTERLILGGILNQSLDFHTCRASLTVDDFAKEDHRTIYKRIEQMCESDIAIDHATVAQELTNNAELETVGGLEYLVFLDEGTPRCRNSASTSGQ